MTKKTRAIVGSALAVLVVLSIWAVTGRGDDGGEATLTATSSSSVSGAAGEAEQTTGVQPDAVAPSTITTATRPGVTVDPALVAPPTSLGQVARYPDDVQIATGDISRDKVEGRGPGSINATLTVFTVTVDNGSDDELDVNRVVATLAYGTAPTRLADPSYDVDVQDFSGTVAPGESTTARYAFNIPDDGLADVSLHVDLDGRRAPAVFTAAIPQ